jgi:hypothetical protein
MSGSTSKRSNPNNGLALIDTDLADLLAVDIFFELTDERIISCQI